MQIITYIYNGIECLSGSGFAHAETVDIGKQVRWQAGFDVFGTECVGTFRLVVLEITRRLKFSAGL